MKLNDTTTRLYLFEFGRYARRSHFDITDKFIADMNKELNLESDNEDGIEITIEHIKEAMTERRDKYPLIMLKDHYDGEFELHTFISEYVYDNVWDETITDDIDYDIDYEEWSEN